MTQDRAAGCLLGTCIGDAWGAPYEFAGPQPIPDGYRTGVFGTAPGHPTDDSTLALFLAEHLAEVAGGAVPSAADVTWGGYTDRLVRWASSGPPDIGGATAAAARAWAAGHPPAPDDAVQGNGSLMALAAVGVAWAGRPDEAAAAGAAFAALTHPSPVAAAVNADAARLLAGLVDGGPLPTSAPELPCAPTESIGWCRLAWAIAQQALVRSATDGPVEALRWAIGLGGDTDTNGAVAGAFVGAAHGGAAWDGWMVDRLAEADRARRLAAALTATSSRRHL